MAFNIVTGNFVSFAVYSEVTARDQRFFESNEGFTEAQVNDLLAQGSQRILTQIRNTDWWRQYQFGLDTSLERDVRLLPAVNALKIKAREQEFKDLNIYFTLSEYLLPRVADFGNETDSNLQKIKFYRDQFDALFKEVIEAGDWYDFDGDATIERTEKSPNRQRLVRIR